MKYILTILTNGRPEYLERTVRALGEYLNPRPTRIYVYDDGHQTPDRLLRVADRVGSSPVRKGMCAAHAECWRAAAESDADFAFHIEDDLVLLRPLELLDLARVMDEEKHLAQMALVRTPWGAEVPHGGYIPQEPGHYERQTTGGWHDFGEGDTLEWMRQRRNWTAAPALFRTELARRFPWPTEDGCETTIGPQILSTDPEAAFGLWGWGEAWVAHIGQERAQGAFGY